MSWRPGQKLLMQVWPIIEREISIERGRVEFTTQFLRLLADWDTDWSHTSGVHPDLDEAMRRAALEDPEFPWKDRDSPPPNKT